MGVLRNEDSFGLLEAINIDCSVVESMNCFLLRPNFYLRKGSSIGESVLDALCIDNTTSHTCCIYDTDNRHGLQPTPTIITNFSCKKHENVLICHGHICVCAYTQ